VFLETAAPVPSVGSLSATVPFSLVAVVKIGNGFSHPAQSNILHNGNLATVPGISLYISGSGKVSLEIKGASSGLLLASGSTVLQTGIPYIIQVTYDGSNTSAGIQAYINGVAETMTSVQNTAIPSGTLVANGPLSIGSKGNTNYANSDYLLELALLNVKLNSAQIAQIDAAENQKWAVHI
jgi:hypothetical protein